MESPNVAIPEAERFQRVPVSQQMACDQRDKIKAEDEADENIAWMMDYFKGCGHNNSWSMLVHLIKNGVLDIVLTPTAMFLLTEWEYEPMEALEEEAEREADKARQLDLWLENEFSRSLRTGDVFLRIREASVTVTNCWLEDQFLVSLQRDEVALEGRMERLLSFLAREESMKPWLEK